jgi:hypothetical protein
MIAHLLTRWPKAAPIVCALLAIFLCADVALAVSTTDVIEMFKYTYGSDKLLYLASQEIVLWRILSRKPLPMGGRGQALMPIRTKNAGVFRGITQAGVLPTQRAQADTQEAAFSLQEFYGVVDVSWKMLQDARKDEYSFERALDFLDQSFRTRVFRLLNADLLGYGKGELGIMPAADNQTTITVRAMPLVDLGMIVDLMDASDDNTKLVGSRTVDAINVDTNEITYSGGAAAGTAALDYFTVADSVAVATGSLHMVGIMAWLKATNPDAVVGNLGGINRATAGNEFWRATQLQNPAGAGTNRPLTEDLMLQAFDAVRKKGGKPVSDLMSNLNIIRRYHELIKQDVFFAMSGGPKELGAGSGIGRDESGMKQGENSDGETIYRFSGVPWRSESFFDANRIIGFNREHFWIGHGENEVPRPLSEIFDDMVPYFTRTANAAYDIESYFQGELISDNPPAGFVIEDIAEA